MKRIAFVVALVAFLLTASYYVVRSRNAAAGPPLPTNNRPPLAAKSGAPAEPRSDLADKLNAPATDIRADLQLVAMIVDTFRSNFPKDGNPVGNNAEITAALTGRNRLRLSLIPPDHPAINQAGELCDRWGTPFFFHADSATQMAVRSAGPDKKMWTGDDVILSP